MSTSDSVLGGPRDISNKSFLVASVVLTIIASLFVAIRLAANWKLPLSKHIDDCLSLIALAFVAGTVAGYDEINRKATDPTIPLQSLIQLSHATNWVGVIAMWSSKAPILILYITLFGIRKWLRTASYATLLVTGVIFLTMASYTTANCDPRGQLVDLSFILSCSNASKRSGFTLGITSVIADGTIFVLPLPIIARLKLPTRKKMGLGIVFLTGVVTIAASTVSANFKWKSLQGSSDGAIGAMLCTIIECTTAIMVGCVPAMYSLWCQSIIISSVYSRLASAFSQRSMGISETSGVSRNESRQPGVLCDGLVHTNNYPVQVSKPWAVEHSDGAGEPGVALANWDQGSY
ncbi:hypothetical protein M434DRAFT_38837 [Hypoxylon sp. CO27-5]|nr:hypothetical protein M434DRAFT_38837 [Hypoxylon sp. CO27-5]